MRQLHCSDQVSCRRNNGDCRPKVVRPGSATWQCDAKSRHSHCQGGQTPTRCPNWGELRVGSSSRNPRSGTSNRQNDTRLNFTKRCVKSTTWCTSSDNRTWCTEGRRLQNTAIIIRFIATTKRSVRLAILVRSSPLQQVRCDLVRLLCHEQ